MVALGATSLLAVVTNLKKKSTAAYCDKVVAHAAPAAPPSQGCFMGTSITSEKKLTTAAAARTINGDLISFIPKQAA